MTEYDIVSLAIIVIFPDSVFLVTLFCGRKFFLYRPWPGVKLSVLTGPFCFRQAVCVSVTIFSGRKFFLHRPRLHVTLSVLQKL